MKNLLRIAKQSKADSKQKPKEQLSFLPQSKPFNLPHCLRDFFDFNHFLTEWSHFENGVEFWVSN